MDIIILNKNSMKLITVITFVTLFLLSINQNDLKFQRNDWEINEITENVLKFNNGKMIETNLYNVGYVKTIYTNQKTPYLILSGKSCEKCDENISIYIHNPEKGNLYQIKSQFHTHPSGMNYTKGVGVSRADLSLMNNTLNGAPMSILYRGNEWIISQGNQFSKHGYNYSLTNNGTWK